MLKTGKLNLFATTLLNSKNKDIKGQSKMQVTSFNNMPIPEIIGDPESYLRNNLNKKELRLLDILIGLFKRFKQVYASQTFLGDMIGVTRETVNRMLKRLCSMGLVNRFNRNNKRTCLYYIPAYFNIPSIRSRLCHVLPTLFALALVPLKPAIAANITQYGYVNRNLNILYRHRRTRINNMKTTKEVMDDAFQNSYSEKQPISLAILQIKNANLVAQVQLSQFPDEAIRYASAAYERGRDLFSKNDFRWFGSVCKYYCELHDILIDKNKVYVLAHRLGVDLKDEPIISREIEKEPVAVEKISEKRPKAKPLVGSYSVYKHVERPQETIEEKRAKALSYSQTEDARLFERLMGISFIGLAVKDNNQNALK